MMQDAGKFNVLIYATTVIVVLILIVNILPATFFPSIKDRALRQMHYEQTIKKKSLSLQKGMFWKEQQQ